MNLQDILTADILRTFADAKTFLRGNAYFHDGAVGPLEVSAEDVHADVQGSELYQVSLAVDAEGALDYECDCPVGATGKFCKHAVAVALAWIFQTSDGGIPEVQAGLGQPKRKRKTKQEHIRDFLETLSEDELRDWLMEAAEHDRNLFDKLLFAAKASTISGVSSLKAVIRQATHINGFIDYREVGAYADRLRDLTGMLQTHIGDGDPLLVELIEETIAEVEQALGNIDDSDGEVYGVLESLQQTHLQACCELRPDPEGLAERLFSYQIYGAWDTFSTVLPGYEGALGEPGLARYKALVAEQWSVLPVLGPSDYLKAGYDSKRSRLERAMESFAQMGGDVDEQVQVMERNLSDPRRFLAVARLLQEQDRADEALAWAEKGRAAFPQDRVRDLVAFCIDAYRQSGDFNKVEELAWRRFTLQPGCEAYFTLLGEADSIGRRDLLRTKALEHLWGLVTEDESPMKAKRLGLFPPKRGELVEIYLREGLPDLVWQTFQGGPVSRSLWSPVAQLRGQTHPEDAISLYLRLLPHVVEVGSRGARYEEAFAVVVAIRALRFASGEHKAFHDELARIRMEFKAKRNFMKLLADL